MNTCLDPAVDVDLSRAGNIPHILARLANIEDNLPTEEDFESVAYSLLLIQHTQGLRTADLLAGRIGDHLAADRISLQDQFQVAKMAVDRDDYYYAAQWLKNMETSGRLAQLRKDEHGFNATNVLGMLASAYFRVSRHDAFGLVTGSGGGGGDVEEV